MKKQQVNRKRNILTIQSLKWIFFDAIIDCRVDGHSIYSNIVRTLILLPLKQMSTKNSTIGVIYILTLTLSL